MARPLLCGSGSSLCPQLLVKRKLQLHSPVLETGHDHHFLPPECRKPSSADGPARSPLTASGLSLAALGVSKVVTVDVKGNGQRWLKVRDLTKGVTYFFRVQARTIAYGPELQANVTAGPAEGEWTPPGSPS